MTLDVTEYPRRSITIFGFGSQGQAWSHALEKSGWDVEVVRRAGLAAWMPNARFVSSGEPMVVALLIPDDQIGELYRNVISKWLDQPTLVVLAHGMAVASGQLKLLSELHDWALLAPKAIGPKITEAYNLASAHSLKFHTLKAAIQKPQNEMFMSVFQDLAIGLGFSENNLIETSFEKETVGDLISEQGLLCGGLFAHLLWTSDRMRREGVPDRLIREECLTELRLIAELLAEKGPVETFKKISPAAKLGAIHMLERLERAGVREIFEHQMDEVVSGRFVQSDFSEELKRKEAGMLQRLRNVPFGEVS